MDPISATDNNDLRSELKERMIRLNQRSAILAENVANASTPGYKARDLAPMSFGDTLKQAQVGMSVTNPKHMLPASMAGVNAHTVRIEGDDAPNGNNVNVEEEMLKISETAVEHQTVTAVLKKVSGLFRIALKGQ